MRDTLPARPRLRMARCTSQWKWSGPESGRSISGADGDLDGIRLS